MNIVNLYENPNNLNDKDNLKGYIYELYCYNYLLENYPDINFIKSHVNNFVTKNNFRYSKYGNIEYWSNNIILSEFDVLGLKNNSIILFEITRNIKTKSSHLRKRLYKKEYLLKKIFKNFKNIEISIITSIDKFKFHDYKIIVIPEPDYSPYFIEGVFKLNKRVNKCLPLKYLNNIAFKYHYIEDLMDVSERYYKGKLDLVRIEELRLFNKFYKVKKNIIEYYDIKNNIHGNYTIIDEIIYNEKNEIVLDKEIYEILKKNHKYKKYYEIFYKSGYGT